MMYKPLSFKRMLKSFNYFNFRLNKIIINFSILCSIKWMQTLYSPKSNIIFWAINNMYFIS